MEQTDAHGRSGKFLLANVMSYGLNCRKLQLYRPFLMAGAYLGNRPRNCESLCVHTVGYPVCPGRAVPDSASRVYGWARADIDEMP